MTTITFKGNPIHTSGKIPQTGTTAPDFSLVRHDLSEVSLQNFTGKKKILNIVPSLDTGVCATSAKTFYQKVSDRDDVILINISMDLPFAQGRFCKAENIKNAEVLSAFRSSFPEEYGVKITEGPLKGLCSRAVLLLDENNKVIHSEQVAEISHEPNYDEVMKKLS